MEEHDITLEEEEITVRSGTHIWKAHLEFYHHDWQIYGFPYLQISQVDDLHYLWELDPDDLASTEYVLVKTGDYDALHQEATEREKALFQEHYPEAYERSMLRSRLDERRRTA